MDMTPFQCSCFKGKFLPQPPSGTPTILYQYTMEQSAWLTWVLCSCGIDLVLPELAPAKFIPSMDEKSHAQYCAQFFTKFHCFDF